MTVFSRENVRNIRVDILRIYETACKMDEETRIEVRLLALNILMQLDNELAKQKIMKLNKDVRLLNEE